MLYTTACADYDAAGDGSFAPLQVHYSERFSAAGRTSGGFLKREGRPKDHEVLVARLIDRPIRPMVQPGWTHSTQLLTWVLSYDGQHSPEPLAITAAGAALALSGALRCSPAGRGGGTWGRWVPGGVVPILLPPQSQSLADLHQHLTSSFLTHPACRPADVPMRRAVAGVRVGLLPSDDDDSAAADGGFGRLVINPTVDEQQRSSLDLMVAGTSEAVLMIEGFCDFLTDEQMLEVRQQLTNGSCLPVPLLFSASGLLLDCQHSNGGAGPLGAPTPRAPSGLPRQPRQSDPPPHAPTPARHTHHWQAGTFCRGHFPLPLLTPFYITHA